MAATSHPLATQIALDILKQDGSAMDAAIAANAALGLMEPTGCGIGGDIFALVWDNKTGQLYGYNGSGRSPRSLTLEQLRTDLQKLGKQKIPPLGVLPITVPGAVDGWFALHKRFGRLTMSDILQPAIDYAEAGHPVPEVISHDWARSVRALANQPGFLQTFTINGRAPYRGEIWRNPALADTYRAIAEGGRDAFYKGDIARNIAGWVRQHGGYLDYDDLADHRGEWVSPVSVDYRGFTVWELPPNGQGIAVLQMLNILELFDVEGMSFGSTDHIHYLVEAKKLAFEDRAKFYADPDFNEIPVSQLISKEYAQNRAALISRSKTARSYPPGDLLLDADTIYLTVADKDRNMVSLIQSNYRGHGSGVCLPTLGFGLQDRGDSFSLEPGNFNLYGPGKRPFHTIIPAFVTRDGRPWLSFGVMGGATQPQGHVQILLNLIDFHMNLQEAADAPRVVHSGSSEPSGEAMVDGGYVALESGFTRDVIHELISRGHNLRKETGIYGGFQGILYDQEQDVFLGASESRKDGQAAGY